MRSTEKLVVNKGGKLFVALFAKMMDSPASGMMNQGLGFEIDGMKISSLLFVDDNVSFADGYEQQQIRLNSVNGFAIKHKIEWGACKCKTMEIGNHREKQIKWKLGDKEIDAALTDTLGNKFLEMARMKKTLRRDLKRSNIS